MNKPQTAKTMIKLLIIDDEVPLLRNLTNFLSSFADEFEVAAAATGEQGLELLREREFDVLLTDVRLPGIDGIDLLPLALEARPNLRIIIMTAFGSSELRSTAMSHGALRFLDKPLDLHKLRALLSSVAENAQGWSGLVGGFDIFDLTQLMIMTQKTRGLRVLLDREEGIMIFRRGNLVHAKCAGLSGHQAFYQMTRWWGGRFTEMSQEEADQFPDNIELTTTQLIIEAARIYDESRLAREQKMAAEAGKEHGNKEHGNSVEPPPRAAEIDRQTEKEEMIMKIKEHLERLNDVEGFLGAGVFTPQGEVLDSQTRGKIDIKSVGLYANNALLNAQKATDQMGVGRGSLLQIQAPKAYILMRCLNEAADFAATKAGKAHFHTMVVMEPEGNVAMARMILDNVVAAIAEELR